VGAPQTRLTSFDFSQQSIPPCPVASDENCGNPTRACQYGLSLLYCIPYSLPPPPLFGTPQLGYHSSIPIWAPLPGLVHLCFMRHSWPPPPFWCSSNTMGASQSPLALRSLDQALFISIPCYPNTFRVLLCSAQYFASGTPLFLVVPLHFHPTISYYLSNPHVDSQWAKISMHLW